MKNILIVGLNSGLFIFKLSQFYKNKDYIFKEHLDGNTDIDCIIYLYTELTHLNVSEYITYETYSDYNKIYKINGDDNILNIENSIHNILSNI